MIVLITLLAIGLLQAIGLDIEMGEDGFTVFLLCGAWNLRLYPLERSESARPDSKKDKPNKGQKKQDKGRWQEIVDAALIKKLLRAGIRTLSRFRRALRFELLRLQYIAGASNVSDAAIQYGYVNAAISAVYPILDSAACVRELDVDTSLDYAAVKPTVYFHVIVNVAAWELFYIGLAFVTDMLNMLYQDR